MSRCLICTLITRHQGKRRESEKGKNEKKIDRRRERNNPNLQEFNDMYFIVSVHECIHISVKMKKQPKEKRTANSIANALTWHVVQRRGNMKKHKLRFFYIITLKMHTTSLFLCLSYTNNTMCTYTCKQADKIHTHTH